MILKNITIYDAKDFAKGNSKNAVYINQGFIKKIAPFEQIKHLDTKVKDCGNKVLLPGIIDINHNLKDLAKDLADALKGGITAIASMPHKNFIDNIHTAKLFLMEAKRYKLAKLYPIGKCTLNINPNALSNQAHLYKHNIAAILASSSINNNLLRRTLEYAKMHNKSLFIDPQNPDLQMQGVILEGQVASELGLPSISSIEQIIEVAKIVEMSRFLEVNVLLKNIYCQRAIEIILAAKKDGIKVSYEMGIHHFILDNTQCKNFNTLAKIYPPLPDKSLRKLFLNHLKADNIDIISSMHSEAIYAHKDQVFFLASNGISSSKNFLSLAYHYLIQPKHISWQQWTRMTSLQPALTLGLDKLGLIKEGYKADLVLFDPNAQVTNDYISPYENHLNGAVSDVFVDSRHLIQSQV